MDGHTGSQPSIIEGRRNLRFKLTNLLDQLKEKNKKIQKDNEEKENELQKWKCMKIEELSESEVISYLLSVSKDKDKLIAETSKETTELKFEIGENRVRVAELRNKVEYMENTLEENKRNSEQRMMEVCAAKDGILEQTRQEMQHKVEAYEEKLRKELYAKHIAEDQYRRREIDLEEQLREFEKGKQHIVFKERERNEYLQKSFEKDRRQAHDLIQELKCEIRNEQARRELIEEQKLALIKQLEEQNARERQFFGMNADERERIIRDTSEKCVIT